MTAITVRDINTNFPEILKRVKLGEEVGILHGNNKIPVAMLVPYKVVLQKTKMLAHEEVENKPLFAETYGMWAGRDIDIKKIRKERRERRTKYYDNATL